jgi:hypothetical protein
MRLPKRLRDGILAIGSNTIGNRGRRTMGFACAAIEPTQTVVEAGEPDDEQWQCGRNECDRKDEQSDGTGQWRQDQPQARPRESEKKSEHGRQRRKRRPQPFP